MHTVFTPASLAALGSIGVILLASQWLKFRLLRILHS